MIQPVRFLATMLVVFVLFPSSGALAGEKDVSFKDLQDRVDQRVADWQPSADEKRFDQIGWCTNLLEAEKLARDHQRPIFLFTHDGRMNVGRC